MKKQEGLKSKEIEKAVAVLKKGGVIVFPTDTVYGIGCQYDNLIAIAKLRKLKASSRSFPVLISNIKQAHRLANLSQHALYLASRFWPGGLTIILERKDLNGKIGLRIPDSEMITSIIDKLGFPIIGTSANFHGQKSPTNFNQIDKRIIEKADYVIKGECKLKEESTVIDVTVSPPKIIRHGATKIR